MMTVYICPIKTIAKKHISKKYIIIKTDFQFLSSFSISFDVQIPYCFHLSSALPAIEQRFKFTY